MLSASNFCMQLQAAPTRADVDRAHRANQWVDIGVSSLRNLKYISRWRKLAWMALALSSLPVHFLYNSAVFQSLTSYDYTVAVVKDSFSTGQTWSLATAEDNRRGDPGWDESRVNPPEWNYTAIITEMQDAVVAGEYLYKNVTACFDLYNDYFAPQGNVVVYVKNESIQTPPSDSLLICCAMIAIVTILFFVSFGSLRRRGIHIDLRTFKSMGFGEIQPYTYLAINLPRQDPEGLMLNVLLANLPQFLLSIIYMFYNAMLSTFLVQREFSHMYKEAKRKPLRVSEPIGIQRGSYFISLPLRYGIPLYVSSGIMHWAISQSLFLARITALNADGSPDVKNSFSTCGYSPIAIFVSLLLGLLLVLAIIGISFRKYDDGPGVADLLVSYIYSSFPGNFSVLAR
ncbi:hypothetical protein VPNG_08901 [Cytospora leucostoma]|uniref:DUF6536 domain-containing protein n=1 Tax=Cytospora leucostoma TaxID=1230097 RepID=A0A423VWX5_9PEZI|nr:hypothetical protein VPNG_08901 [Cytospora leucostoma]